MRILASVLFIAVACAKHEEYQGWKSFYVSPFSSEQLQALDAMVPQFDLDIISYASTNRRGVVLVKPHHQSGFAKALMENKISFKVNAADVKSQLDVDDKRMERQKSIAEESENNLTISYDNYQDIGVIDRYLQEIATNYPHIATLVTPAQSFEGHPIQYLKISTTNFMVQKPTIFITAGISAREWIGPPTVTYAITKLVQDLDEDEADLLEKYDWILLPVVNPDGYKYSFSRRFWHKNRSTDQHIMSNICPGVDIDLNFDFHWSATGTNSFPCYDNFPGGSAFSEVETRVIRDILLEHELFITLYISMQSYGSYVLYPWGHDGSLSGNAFALHTVGVNMVDAIHEKALEKFKRYTVGNSVLVTGQFASGSSVDYAHSLGIPLTYDFELPGLDDDLDGFHLPPEYIKQVVEETWAAIVVGARRSAELFWDQ